MNDFISRVSNKDFPHLDENSEKFRKFKNNLPTFEEIMEKSGKKLEDYIDLPLEKSNGNTWIQFKPDDSGEGLGIYADDSCIDVGFATTSSKGNSIFSNGYAKVFWNDSIEEGIFKDDDLHDGKITYDSGEIRKDG